MISLAHASVKYKVYYTPDISSCPGNMIYAIVVFLCLYTCIKGVKFVSSLKHDGSIETAAGVVYRYPNQWINGCWEKIGHKGKKMRLAAAYKIVRNHLIMSLVYILFFCVI